MYKGEIRGLGNSGKALIKMTPVAGLSPYWNLQQNNIWLFPREFLVLALLVRLPADSSVKNEHSNVALEKILLDHPPGPLQFSFINFSTARATRGTLCSVAKNR